MLQTRITEMLGIEHPIIQGGMQWLARAELVSAVANAGAFGFLSATSCRDADGLRDEIRRTRNLTDRPFGVNISMLPVVMPGDLTDAFIHVACAEQVTAVETAGRSPEPYVAKLKSAGVKLIHKAPALRFAKKAEAIGADAVTIVGFECAGFPGMDDVPSLILLPKAAAKLSVPVIAAGGFCDGPGLVAALALGAEAVLMGTRFVLAAECPAHDRLKERLVAAGETDTTLIQRSIRNAVRVMHNQDARAIEAMEAQGATMDKLIPAVTSMAGKGAYLDGDVETGLVACGQVVGRITAVKPVRQIVDDIMAKAGQTLARLGGAFAS